VSWFAVADRQDREGPWRRETGIYNDLRRLSLSFNCAIEARCRTL